MATVTPPYFETVKVTTSVPLNPRLPSLLIPSHIQSFADVPVTSDGVETATFLDASDGLVNMFGEHRNKSTGPTPTPTPPERSPWHWRVFLCPSRSASQHRGAPFSCLSGRPSMPAPQSTLTNPTETGGPFPPCVASVRIHHA
jgi:hypothetical protein